jgi:hypothetical protein
MNKTLLAAAILTIASVEAFAQGSVNVNNRFGSPATIRAVTLPAELGGAGVAGANWVAQIVYGAGNEALGPNMSFRPAGNLAGAWVPTSNGGANDRILTGVAAGQTAALTVRVWDTSVFPTWTEAAAALQAGVAPVATAAGVSTFNYTVPPAGTLDPSQFNITSFNGFQLTYIPVPEPTTIALGALGVGALLWRRRSK